MEPEFYEPENNNEKPEHGDSEEPSHVTCELEAETSHVTQGLSHVTGELETEASHVIHLGNEAPGDSPQVSQGDVGITKKHVLFCIYKHLC